MTPIEKKILRHMVKASDEYKLIEDGDKIMVCMSGGKDSFAMLHMLQVIQNPIIVHSAEREYIIKYNNITAYCWATIF